METNQTEVQQTTSADAPKQKKRLRIPKLTAADLAAIPGATLPQDKCLTNYIEINVPVTSPVGNLDEVTQTYGFAYSLDEEANAKNVGKVISVGVADSNFNVVLELNTAGEKPKPSAPALSGFIELKEFLDGVSLLKQDPAGTSATYKLKVNGTTTYENSF